MEQQVATTDHSLSLWQLETELVELMAFREDCETEEERAACDTQIAEYVKREIRKVDGIRDYLRHCEVMAAAAKEEADRQVARARAWDARKDRLKAMCQQVMELFKLKRLEGATGHLLLKANGGPQALTVYDESLIPESMCEYQGRISSSMWAAILRACPALSAPDVSREDIEMRRVVVSKAVRETMKGMCSHCRGTGKRGINEPVECDECNGDGKARVAGARLEERGQHVECK